MATFWPNDALTTTDKKEGINQKTKKPKPKKKKAQNCGGECGL